MLRCALLFALLSACASQPICKPWGPELTATASGATAPAPAAPAAEIPDDGTIALAPPTEDETWTSVVGAAPEPAAAAPAAEPAKPTPRKHHGKRTAAAKPAAPRTADTPAKPAEVATAKPAEPRPAEAKADEPAAKPEADAMKAEARAFFNGRCQMCHGEGGRGDGPTGKALTPTPRNFTDKTWQKSVSDAHIEKVILNGGASVGKSPLMPAHGDIADKPELVHALRRLVRSFGR